MNTTTTNLYRCSLYRELGMCKFNTLILLLLFSFFFFLNYCYQTTIGCLSFCHILNTICNFICHIILVWPGIFRTLKMAECCKSTNASITSRMVENNNNNNSNNSKRNKNLHDSFVLLGPKQTTCFLQNEKFPWQYIHYRSIKIVQSYFVLKWKQT